MCTQTDGLPHAAYHFGGTYNILFSSAGTGLQVRGESASLMLSNECVLCLVLNLVYVNLKQTSSHLEDIATINACKPEPCIYWFLVGPLTH